MIKRRFQSMGHKSFERKVDSIPTRSCCEMRPVGLPRSDVIWRAEMNRVILTIATRDNAQTSIVGRVKGPNLARQVECCLDKTTVILQTDIPCQVQTGTPIYHAIR